MAKRRRHTGGTAPPPKLTVPPTSARRKHPVPDVTDNVDHFDEAMHAFRKRLPVSRETWDQLAAEERQFAFMVSGVAHADMIFEVWDAIDRAIRDGTDIEDFKQEFTPKLGEAWGAEDAPRVETIFRTNVQTAYNEGRYEVFSAPAVKEMRPYFRFDAIDDDRTDDECRDLNGTVLEQDDGFWDDNHPPLHFNALDAETLITTSVGAVPIAQVRPGMLVLTHRRRWRRVTDVMHKLSRRTILVLRLASGGVLRVTHEHPVLRSAAGGVEWRKAGDLQPGDHVLQHAHEMMRTLDTVTVNADDAPPEVDEVPVADQVVRAPLRGPVILAVDLDGNPPPNEREVDDVRTDRVLRHEARGREQREDVLLSWGEHLPVGDRLRGGGARADVQGSDGVAGAHPVAVSSHEGGGRRAQAPGPVLLAGALGDRDRVTVRDPHLVSARADGDPVLLAPLRQDAVREPVLSFEGAQAAALLGVLDGDQVADGLGVAGVEWHRKTITSIVDVGYFGELCDLSVEEDESYVAGGIVVHNCRCMLTALSQDEADDEGADDEAPDVDHADEGFGDRPDREGADWEPDFGKYPDEIADALKIKIGY